jgi:ADP-ribose pyrophosphatase
MTESADDPLVEYTLDSRLAFEGVFLRLFVDQVRSADGRSVVEFPAGKIDPGEPPFGCAQRELLEETGYVARRWSYLGGLHNAIAYSDEKIEIFLAEGLELTGDATPDAGETLEVFEAPWRQLLEWVRDGSVTDVKTMVGAFWLEKTLAGEWVRRPPSEATR